MTDFEIIDVLIKALPDYDRREIESVEINRAEGYIILVYDRDIDNDDPNDPANSLPMTIDGLRLLLA